MVTPEPSVELKIFISYSRKDCSDFAQDLLTGLELLGFDPFLDKHDIAAGEDWEERLANLIQTADTMIYVVSPQSVQSERCGWEVDKAIALGKRIIPVIALAVADDKVPSGLKKLNYIFFNEPNTFARALKQLTSALKTDLSWIREHTRLGDLAARWNEREKLDALLLRGPELDAASEWLSNWKPGAPEVTDLIRSFISASREAEDARQNRERQRLAEMASAQAQRAEALAEREAVLKQLSRRTTLGLIGAGTLTAAGAGLAYWGNDAERRFREAQTAANEAQKRSIDEAIRQAANRTDIVGQLVAYAAAPGGVAMDGDEGDNSPYTKTAMKELADTDTSLQDGLARTTQWVLKATNSQQRPYIASDLNGPVFLLRRPPAQRRRALTISVDSFKNGPKLANVERDAAAWKSLLERAGFETRNLRNPTKAEFLAEIEKIDVKVPEKQGSLGTSLVVKAAFDALSDLRLTAPPENSLLVVFYAGFGVLHTGREYLAATDTEINAAADVPAATIDLKLIQASLREKASATALILDTNFSEVFLDTR